VAPMMDWTDPWFRHLCRLLSRHVVLWTEMVVDSTVLHADRPERHLWSPKGQSPCVLQLGGSDPEKLREAARRAGARWGYDGVNLNVGCPSDRVAGAGCFGAALMAERTRVGECVRALSEGLAAAEAKGPPVRGTAEGEEARCGDDPDHLVRFPPLGSPTPASAVSVKCRIGVDELDSFEDLCSFVETVRSTSGCTDFIVHARKAWLAGLSPAQNRTVPPLRHEWVFALAARYPDCSFHLNGGVGSCHEAAAALAVRAGPPEDASAGDDAASDREGSLAGVMVGRSAYHQPWRCLADADRALYGDPRGNPCRNRRDLLDRYCAWADAEAVGRYGRRGVHGKGKNGRPAADQGPDPPVRALVAPLLGLFAGDRGSNGWKRALEEVLNASTKWRKAEILAEERRRAAARGPEVKPPADEPPAGEEIFEDRERYPRQGDDPGGHDWGTVAGTVAAALARAGVPDEVLDAPPGAHPLPWAVAPMTRAAAAEEGEGDALALMEWRARELDANVAEADVTTARSAVAVKARGRLYGAWDGGEDDYDADVAADVFEGSTRSWLRGPRVAGPYPPPPGERAADPALTTGSRAVAAHKRTKA